MSRTEEVLEQIDDALDDWTVGPDAVRFNAPPEARRAPLPRNPETPRMVTVVIAVDVEGYLRKLSRLVERLGILGSQPVGLSIDGHAYHRRRRARARRSR